MPDDGEKTPETKFELVGEEEEAKNWKGMVLSVMVIAAVFIMVIIAIIFNKPDPIITDKVKLTFDDFTVDFEPKRFNGNWISKNQFSFLDKNKDIRLFNCDWLNSTVLLSNHNIYPMIGDQFTFAQTTDPNILLLAYDKDQLNRHSFLARYKIYNIETNMVIDVTVPDSFENVPLQNAQLSPDSKKLAFVEKNNIYLLSFASTDKQSTQITSDGQENTIYNGIADWVYEEEVLHTTNAMHWSPASNYLAYIKFDDSQVEEFTILMYNEEPYADKKTIRYPKVDSTNPTATVHVYDLNAATSVQMNVPNSVSQGFNDYYIWSIEFCSDSELVVVYVNRSQKKSITVVYDVTSGTAKLQKEYPSTETQEDTWNTPTGLLISTDHSKYFQVWSVNNYANIIAFNIKTGSVEQITDHQFDVMELLKVNDKSGDIYYVATNGDPMQRHVFKKQFTSVDSVAQCLTCQDSDKVAKEFVEPYKNLKPFNDSVRCLYHTASFSLNGDYYALECLGDRIPVTYIRSSINSKLNFIYEDNAELQALVDSKFMPKRAYKTIVFDDENNATAELYYPIGFDPIDKIYPVLVYTYGGPNSQVVDYQFNVRKFEAYMVTNFDVIVAMVNGRGSSANGEKYMKSVYKKLGKLEMHDQLKLAESLQEEKYTDDSKFAIWGWSYGGYLTGLALLNETSPFSCGISGAPVTEWQLYNTAYTERYLGSYSENHRAYDESSLLEFAKKNAPFYSRRRMMLVHGTGDDNVHFQNSAVLANYLRQTNLDLDFEVYPNDRHTPSPTNQPVFFKGMTRFLLNCYDIDYTEHLEALNLHHLIVLPPPPPAE